MSDVTSGMTLTYLSSDSLRDSYATETTTLDSRSTVGAIALVGWNIDSSTATSTGMTSTKTGSMTTSTSATASASQTSSGSGSSSSNSDSDSGGLSSGAKAGIGIGVGVGGIGVLALLVALWMFRRRKSSKAPTPDPEPPVTQPQHPSQPPILPPTTAASTQHQQWYNAPGAIPPPSNSDNFPSSASQASGAVAGSNAPQSPGTSHGQSETIISSMSTANHQRGGSAHLPPQLDPVEIPAGPRLISELQGSMQHPAETNAPGTQPGGGR